MQIDLDDIVKVRNNRRCGSFMKKRKIWMCLCCFFVSYLVSSFCAGKGIIVGAEDDEIETSIYQEIVLWIQEEWEIPEDGCEIQWMSQNEEIVSVQNGSVFHPNREGETEIVGTTENGVVGYHVKVYEDRWKYLLEKYRGDDEVQQLIFVKYKGKSRAQLQFYEKKELNWKKTISCSANVGKNGIDKEKEGDKKTPTGVYSLPMAFGLKEDPGTALSYKKINAYDYWCSDKNYYNQLIDIRKHRHNCRGEHMCRYRTYYDYGVFIGYNIECEYPKGSAIFLHCQKRKSATSGCVTIPKAKMKKIIRRLTDGAKICIYHAE